MSKTTSMNIRIDEKTRRGLKKFAEEIGIPASSLVTASIRQMIKTQTAIFTTSLTPTPYLESLIKDAEADYKAGKNISPSFNSVDDMLDYLDNDA